MDFTMQQVPVCGMMPFPMQEPQYVVASAGYERQPQNLCPPEKTLWMGSIDANWTSEFIMEAFGKFGFQVHNVKLVTEKGSERPASYCFVEFAGEDDARNAMLKANGRTIKDDPERRRFHLSFANSPEPHTEFNLFVNNLSTSVDDVSLFKVFGEKYKSCRGAKVYRTHDGVSKESGFVRFMSETDQQMALVEMNKVKLKGREMILKLAHPKHRSQAPRGRGGFSNRTQGYQGQPMDYGMQQYPSGSQFGNNQPYGMQQQQYPNQNYQQSYNSRDSYRSGRHSYSSRSRDYRRSRSPTNRRSPVVPKHFIEPIEPPTVDEHNEHIFETDWDFQMAMDSARFSKYLIPVDIKSKDLAVKLYEIAS